MKIKLKRVYDNFSNDDGFRILVDRLWPRGIKKEQIKIDIWAKEIAPSNELRKWFNHDPKRWDEFRIRYLDEINSNASYLNEFISSVNTDTITLIYSTKNLELNQAVILKEYIEKYILKE